MFLIKFVQNVNQFYILEKYILKHIAGNMEKQFFPDLDNNLHNFPTTETLSQKVEKHCFRALKKCSTSSSVYQTFV